MVEQSKALTPVKQVESFLNNEDLRKRFNGMLGAKTNQFISSILNAVSANKSLQECDPKSIISAALVAASLDLPIDGNLGFSAMVPYGSKDGKRAQFQIMAKGFIQLAIRSGKYVDMNYSEIYQDELISYNPITKELKYKDTFDPNGQREKGETHNIVGYLAWFKLSTGFKQSLYMTVAQIKNHAKKYSVSYKYDLSKGQTSSKWSQDFHPMALKTVIKLLLSKWGILSVDMQKAMKEDQKAYGSTEEDGIYIDGNETIDVESESSDDIQQTLIEDPIKKRKDEKKNEIHEKIRNSLKEKYPNEEDWQIDARMKELVVE
ncbi:MAG: recombinase RecT [Bacteroidia bacterium]|nr:recombinase RecT [Bacteroidia bacterium]